MDRRDKAIEAYSKYSIAKLLGDVEGSKRYYQEYLQLQSVTYTYLNYPLFNN
jgi:hypothetical protein